MEKNTYQFLINDLPFLKKFDLTLNNKNAIDNVIYLKNLIEKLINKKIVMPIIYIPNILVPGMILINKNNNNIFILSERHILLGKSHIFNKSMYFKNWDAISLKLTD